MKRKFNTPQLMWLSVAAIAVLAVALMTAALWAVSLHRQALKTVAKDAAPSIIAAQQMRAALSDMDANVANELLGATDPKEALKAYELRRKQVGDALVVAAENVTYGDAERLPLQTLIFGLSNYERQVQRARDLLRQDHEAARIAYREAAGLMSGQLLRAAGDLDQANQKELDKTYEKVKAASGVSKMVLRLAAIALLLVLAWVQAFLSNRTRRLLNVMLLAATGVTAGFWIYTDSAVSSGAQELKHVKEDAFDSIHALWKTMATVYDANAEESRYLFDAPNAGAWVRDFLTHSNQIASVPKGLTAADLAKSRALPLDFKGLLADELRNITYEGEREAALETLKNWQVYLEIDHRIRDLNQSGKVKEAVTLCVGSKPGESNWAFDRLEGSIRKTIGINQTAFDKSAEKGFQRLAGFEVVAPVAALLIAGLGFFGLMVRIREYSA